MMIEGGGGEVVEAHARAGSGTATGVVGGEGLAEEEGGVVA